MSPDNSLYKPETDEQRRARLLVHRAEQARVYCDQYPFEVKRAEDFLTGLGGVKIDQLPFRTVPQVIASLGDHPIYNHAIHFSPVDYRRSFDRKIFNVHEVQTLIDMSPQNNELWEKSSDEGKVIDEIYSQKVGDGEDEVITFPDGFISFREDSFTIHFVGIGERIIQNPEPMGVYGFQESPAVLSRAWRIYANTLQNIYHVPAITLNTFDPEVAIEFSLANPRHGRPIKV